VLLYTRKDMLQEDNRDLAPISDNPREVTQLQASLLQVVEYFLNISESLWGD